MPRELRAAGGSGGLGASSFPLKIEPIFTSPYGSKHVTPYDYYYIKRLHIRFH